MVSLSPEAVSAVSLPPHCRLPSSSSRLRSLVVVAGGGRDLCGSPAHIAAALLEAAAGRLVHRLFHGGARGADRLIHAAAVQLGWPVAVIPAQWARYGLAAGPVRNRLMLRRASAEAVLHSTPRARAGVLVLAFPGHRGTASLLEQAHRLRCRCPVPLEVIDLAAG